VQDDVNPCIDLYGYNLLFAHFCQTDLPLAVIEYYFRWLVEYCLRIACYLQNKHWHCIDKLTIPLVPNQLCFSYRD
jgi:hypothetical protein